MSLKRRDIIAWVLLLAAAAALVFGMSLRRESSDESSYESETRTVMTTTVAYEPESSAERTESTTYETTKAWSEEESVAEIEDDAEALLARRQAQGLLLLIAGGMLAVTGIFFVRQRQAVLGPDGSLVLAAVLFVADYGNSINSAVDLVTWRILFVFLLMVCLRELFGWACARGDLSWCATERLSSRAKTPSGALAWDLIWCVIPFSASIAAYLSARLWFGMPFRLLAASACQLLAGVFGVLSLLRYGAALKHLQTQLAHFRDGEEISVQAGPFAETEEKLRDVQERHAEAIRQAVSSERFKVELISNVSHDLRTPLTSILGYGELLAQQELTDEGTAQLTKLNHKAAYMRDLVDALFELTKVSSGVIEAKSERIDLIRLLEQTIGLFDEELTAAGLVVKRRYEASEILLDSDGTMLHQVFANLLENAIKYALPGSRIYLEVSGTQGEVRVRMVNTASYEMDFTAEEIVQRFARGDKARSTKGSGIGLAIAQTYTEAVGGTFEIGIDGDQFSAVVTLPKEKIHDPETEETA